MENKFARHIDELGRILLLFKVNPDAAAEALEAEKRELEADSSAEDELLAAATYNALAAIRTSPEQEKPVGQLIDAISDARAELMAISEYAAEEK